MNINKNVFFNVSYLYYVEIFNVLNQYYNYNSKNIFFTIARHVILGDAKIEARIAKLKHTFQYNTVYLNSSIKLSKQNISFKVDKFQVPF